MNKQNKIFIMIVLFVAINSLYSQTNSIHKSIYESKELCVTYFVFDRIYEYDDSIYISIDYKNKSNKDLFIYDPSFSQSRSDFINVDTTTSECILELGGSFLWDLGRPNSLKLKMIRPHSNYYYDLKIKIPPTNHEENPLLFNDIFAWKQHILLAYGYVGYISDLNGIKLILNGEFVRINETDGTKEVELFEKNYCRVLIGPLIVKVKNIKK